MLGLQYILTKDFAKNTFKYIWQVAGIYILWIFIHYISSHLYIYFCTPYSFLGFLTAPLLVASPHCSGLRWCIFHGAQTITSMWIVFGSWLITLLVINGTNNGINMNANN